MKHAFSQLILVLAWSLLTVACKPDNSQTPEILAAHFSTTPPREAYPWVWWHWMDGNISKDGIRKDLLWMHSIGISGLHQFDAGGRNTQQLVQERIPYLSEAWKDAFRYALHLTDSLGIDVAVASSPGWSSTGGPWVPPEQAMKKLVWRTLETEGGQRVLHLPEPCTTVGKYQDIPYAGASDIEPWYKDIAVVAVRMPENDRSLKELGATVSSSEGTFSLDMLTDGCFSDFVQIGAWPGEDAWIRYDFPEPQSFRSVTIGCEAFRPRFLPMPAPVRMYLECSDDGVHFRSVAPIPDNVLCAMTIDFPAQTARHWRLRIPRRNGAAAKGHRIREFHLHPVAKVNRAEEKAGFAAQIDFMEHPTPDSPDAIRDIVILGEPAKDGALSCSLPQGRWRIYRFGQTLTGKKNHPAPKDATGLEVDKLDPQAWTDHFRHYLNLYQEASGGMMGRRGIQYLLTDSYEAEQMTWTRKMPEEFKARKGYDLIRWLPALAGEILDSSSETERFLWDWREVIGDLFAENYDRINGIIQEYGMSGRFTEAHELGRLFVGDGMDLKQTAAFPMSAIWMENTPSGHKVWMGRADIQESASTAHLFGQNIVSAESFSVSGLQGHAYTYCPGNMKRTADLALAAGLNRFVIHESAHQPSDDHQPGAGLFQYGQWFNRHETWAPMARAWTDYLARSCYLLQQGRFVADILWYYGEDHCITGLYGVEQPEIPDGYAFDFINPKGLLKVVRAEKGHLVTDSGMSYSILALGENCRRMSLPVLKQIVEFARSGVTVCGTLPQEPAGLNDDPQQFVRLRNRLKTMMTGRTVAQALQTRSIPPDATFSRDSIAFVHRVLPEMDIYWVRNFAEGPDQVDVDVTLRAKGGKFLERWDPETGGRWVDSHAQCSATSVSTTLSLGRDEACFLVVRKEGTPAPEPAPMPQDSLRIDGPWTVRFQPGRKAPEKVTFEALTDWSQHPDDGIRYFSGIATYSVDFQLSSVPRGRTVLDLGAVKDIARVRINGIPCGIAWKDPFQLEIPAGVLREGRNELEIQVANLWVNRIIGDCQPDCKDPVTTTPMAFYKANDPLLPSGLLGPVLLRHL